VKRSTRAHLLCRLDEQREEPWDDLSVVSIHASDIYKSLSLLFCLVVKSTHHQDDELIKTMKYCMRPIKA
jgi:hypothetical protein